MVLLRLASGCFSRTEILAVHVNHGLHPDACEWERFCRCAAARLGVTFRSLRVQVQARSGRGIEAAARDARYAALKLLLSAATC